MLVNLKIANFALIDRLELDLDRGLNVMTGETGAGKSIILDAIDLTLGGKTSTRQIRSGCDRALIEATFAVAPELNDWLHSLEIDLLEEDTLICSRELVIGKNSKLRSRCRVNGTLVNLQLMAELRSRLVEITAQGQTINLLIPEKQRDLLDVYGSKSVIEQRAKVASAFKKFQQLETKLKNRRQSEQELLQRQDLLKFQLKELQEAELSELSELDDLAGERDRLAHVVELQHLSYQVYQLLYQNDGEEPAAADLVGQAESYLEEMSEYDSSLAAIVEMVQSGMAQIIEAGQQISRYGEDLEADPERLGEIEARIRLLKNICRKYGPDLADAIALQQKLEAELAQLTDSEQSIEALETERQQAFKKLERVCSQLTQLRQQAASQLERQLIAELKPLAMDKVVFECRLIPQAPNATGADKVVFYFSPNAGETIQPLSETASGGEMSRFLLALKACFSDSERGSSTLIFDEIDAGVSGKVAQAIAEKLHQLSQQHQVLCVTHQPLVAAMADGHYKVEKTIIEAAVESANDRNGDSSVPPIRTVVRVRPLGDRQLRTQEIAQITGGHSAEEAVAFAESLLTKATAYRQKRHS